MWSTSRRPHSGKIYEENLYPNNLKWRNVVIRSTIYVHNIPEIYTYAAEKFDYEAAIKVMI